MRKLILPLLLAISPIYGSEIPKGTQYDKRVQYVKYNPDQVVVIKSKVGFATVVELEAGEFLEGDVAGIGIGDANAWRISPKGNKIFFKPVASSPQTNMIISTNRRTYIFDLRLVKKSQAVTYLLRFNYSKLPNQKSKNNKKLFTTFGDVHPFLKEGASYCD